MTSRRASDASTARIVGFRFVGFPFGTPAGPFSVGTPCITDIDERKRTEDALRHSEASLRAIVETTPECVHVIAGDGTLIERERRRRRDGGRTIRGSHAGAELLRLRHAGRSRAISCVSTKACAPGRRAFWSFTSSAWTASVAIWRRALPHCATTMAPSRNWA